MRGCAERLRGRAVGAAVERVQPFAVGEKRREVLRTLLQDALTLGLGQLDTELRGEAEDELLLEVEELPEGAIRLRARPRRAVTAHHRGGEPDGAVRRDRRHPLHHALRPQQPPHPRGGGGIGALRLPQLELVEQHADLHALEQPQRAHQRQVGGEQLGKPARQRLEAGIAGDRQREHGESGGLRGQRRQGGLPRQRHSGRLLRLGAQRQLRLGPDRRHAPRPRTLRRELGVRGERQIGAPFLLLARALEQRPERVPRREQPARPRHRERRVGATGGEQRRGEAEANLRIVGLVGGLGL